MTIEENAIRREELDENAAMSPPEVRAAKEIVDAFNNIFAGIHERIVGAKGNLGRRRYAATLQKSSFQKTGFYRSLMSER